jgi:hypothetical protein
MPERRQTQKEAHKKQANICHLHHARLAATALRADEGVSVSVTLRLRFVPAGRPPPTPPKQPPGKPCSVALAHARREALALRCVLGCVTSSKQGRKMPTSEEVSVLYRGGKWEEAEGRRVAPCSGHGDGGQLEVTRQWVWRRRGAWRR